MTGGTPAWLPPLMELAAYGGNWQQYIDAVYAVFYGDFIARRARYGSREILFLGYDGQLLDGKERRFWHCVTEGNIEEDRVPDLRRCERVPWMRPVIENASDVPVDVWVEDQGRKGLRPHLWVNEEYLIVLERLWKGDFRLITTFHTLEDHQVRKYRRRRDEWIKKNAASEDGA